MKKFVSKRRRNNGSKRVKRKNIRSKRRNTISKRRRYTRTKKNKKLIGGVIEKIPLEKPITLTYDLKTHPSYPNLRDAVEAELEKSKEFEITEEIKDLPLDDKDQPSIIVADQIKVEKTGELYSVTVVKNFGEGQNFGFGGTVKVKISSIKLANVSNELLESLIIKTIYKNISDSLGNKHDKTPEDIKNIVCEHLLMFFNKFTKSCSNSTDVIILTQIQKIQKMTIEDLSNKAKELSAKLNEVTPITLFSLIKQFLCLEPIQFETTGGGGFKVFFTPVELAFCIFFGVFAFWLSGKENNEAFDLMVTSGEMLSEHIKFWK